MKWIDITVELDRRALEELRLEILRLAKKHGLDAEVSVTEPMPRRPVRRRAPSPSR